MKSLFETFAESMLPNNKIMNLSAIHLENFVTISTGENKYRITPGMKIRVEAGRIVSCSDNRPATHEVKGCMGTISSSFLEMILKNLETGLPENLQIK